MNRNDLAQAAELTARIVKLAIESKSSALQGQVNVHVDFAHDFFFRAVHDDGDKVKLFFGIGALHPRFSEMVQEARRACYDLRFTNTPAIEIRKSAQERSNG